jgi:Tfp pilus assembly protein PilV
MSPLRCIKGMSLVEVLVALFLVVIGMLSLMSLQPAAWRTSNRSDFLGRAGGILHQELETNRILIMNESNGNPCATKNPQVYPPRYVIPSGQATQQLGDVTFTVLTAITDLAPAQPGSWRVTVNVNWPGNTNGITETIVVGRQLSLMWPPL